MEEGKSKDKVIKSYVEKERIQVRYPLYTYLLDGVVDDVVFFCFLASRAHASGGTNVGSARSHGVMGGVGGVVVSPGWKTNTKKTEHGKRSLV